MSNPNENTQVAKASPKATFQQLVESDKFKSQIMMALPKHLTPERFVRVLMTATLKTPKLLECTQESMFNGIFTAAAAGLEIDGRRAALVPLRNRKKEGSPLEANLWIMYQGIAEMIMRSGVVSNIHSDLVCENDEFDYDRGILVKHKIDYRKNRGEPYAVYALIRMKDGSEKVEVMSAVEVERIRKGSPGADADAWRLNWGEMAKKTAFKRAAKWVPWSAEIKNVLEADYEPEPVNVTPKPSLETLIGPAENQKTRPTELAVSEAAAAEGMAAEQKAQTPPPATGQQAPGSSSANATTSAPQGSEAAVDRAALLKQVEDAMLAAMVGETKVLKFARDRLGATLEHDEVATLPTDILAAVLSAIPTIKQAAAK